jgi:hypothetical protein
MKVTAKILDSVLDTIFNTNADNLNTIAEKSNLSKSVTLKALLILAHDKYVDLLSIKEDPTYHVSLNATGIKFINDGGYNEIERVKKLNESQIKSVIRTNVLTWINAAITIFLTIIVIALQFKADKRESHKEDIEVQNKLEQSKHDSLYEIRLRRIEDIYQKNRKDSTSTK